MFLCFSTGKKDYKVIREVFTGKTNDVYVCQNNKEPAAPYKTVWIVKERKTAKALMGSFGNSCEEFFMQNEKAGFVFPYFEERPLHKFYLSNIQNANCSRRQIWLELVVKCMTCGLPAAVLSLMLNQDQIHIGPDGKIWFGFFVDLSEYDDSVCERDNAAVCADRIARLIGLEREAQKAQKVQKVSAVSTQAYTLLEKKLSRNEYTGFVQLYRDMKLISQMEETGDIRIAVKRKIAGMKNFAVSNQDRIYRLLSCICIVLVCMVVFVLAGHLFFGEFSFWKLFAGPLDRIGTESLLQ